MKRLTILLLSLLLALRASAITFTFAFDNDTTPGIQVPVGIGSFTFANDPGNGTFAFNSLGAFSMMYSFINASAFTQADITSGLSKVLVVLSTSGTTRRLQFSDTGAGGGGNSAGSLDLDNGTGDLSFEPSYFGGNLDLYFINGSNKTGFFGNYLATTTAGTAVPEGGSTQMMLLLPVVGILALHSLRRCSLPARILRS